MVGLGGVGLVGLGGVRLDWVGWGRVGLPPPPVPVPATGRAFIFIATRLLQPFLPSRRLFSSNCEYTMIIPTLLLIVGVLNEELVSTAGSRYNTPTPSNAPPSPHWLYDLQDRIYSFHAQIEVPRPSPPPRSLFIKPWPPRPSKLRPPLTGYSTYRIHLIN